MLCCEATSVSCGTEEDQVILRGFTGAVFGVHSEVSVLRFTGLSPLLQFSNRINSRRQDFGSPSYLNIVGTALVVTTKLIEPKLATVKT